MVRPIYAALGWMAVGLGLIGAVLPVLPTTPFMILAAFLFAKGSPRAREWLVERSAFGAHIQRWEQDGAIARPAKLLAITMMTAVIVASLIFGLSPWIVAVQITCILPAAIFVWTRPEPSAPAADRRDHAKLPE